VTARHLTLFALFALLACGVGTATPPGYPYRQQEALVPAYGPTYSASDDLLKQILDEVKGLRKDVQGLKAGQQPTQDGALGVVATRCLSCHQDGKAQDKGGGFVMVEKDGSLAEMSLAEKRRVVRLVGKGDMPPGGKLPEAEVKALTDYFTPKTEEQKR